MKPMSGFPRHKTRIVCTIGPASGEVRVMEELIRAGMNIARLNFSHADFDVHRRFIRNLREASRAAGRDVTIMADLPGPKMRIGAFAVEPVELRVGAAFTLTTEPIIGDSSAVSVSFTSLPKIVAPGTLLYLNDGIIQLEVTGIEGPRVRCIVRAGGELRARKGLNIPGIALGVSAFTERDRECLTFALGEGVEAVSQSFVENAADIAAVRSAATALGARPFLLAKIERLRALENLEGILAAADGVMIARGDLGVEIPIEEIAVVQKRIILLANRMGKPVITATQMLESMIGNPLPTRAEATDVANAIIDGTDAVMLSGESAVGKYPVESVRMLARIAEATEPHVARLLVRDAIRADERARGRAADPGDVIPLGLEAILEHLDPVAIVIPTLSGATARNVARFKFPVWIAGVSTQRSTCSHLMFSYGVMPLYEEVLPDDWRGYIRSRLVEAGLPGDIAVLVEGPSARRPEANHRIELIELKKSGKV